MLSFKGKYFKLISFVMVIVCILSFLVAMPAKPIVNAEGTQKFIDVPDGYWASSYINQLASPPLNVIQGKGDGTFGPTLNASRAEFATFMDRALNVDTSAAYQGIFTDVPADKWYASYVEAAYAKGIIKGKGNSTFEPEMSITRQEVATVIANTVAFKENSTVAQLAAGYDISGVTDADKAASWALDGIKICYKFNITNGYSDGTFNPLALITRAEVAKIISVYIDYANTVPTPTATPVPTPSNSPANTPEPPRVFLDTTYTEPTGSTIKVNQGGDLQAAINQAKPGDIIELQAGATFVGNYYLPNKSGSGWIYIRSSNYANLPKPGNRVSKDDAVNMPKIVTPSSNYAIYTQLNAHNYRLVGLEVTAQQETYDLIGFGSSGDDQSSLNVVAHDLVIDRCFLHGLTNKNLRRAVALNSASSSVIDSYISDCHTDYPDSQGIAGFNGPGPFKIVNNYIEGGSENIIFGGADAKIPNNVPSDIEVRGNYLFKPLAWKDTTWNVKNIFELKCAKRVLVEGNIMENCWINGDQQGYGVLFTPRNQNGGNPWATIKDVLFTKNVVKNCYRAVTIMGTDDGFASDITERITMKDNVFDNIVPPAKGNFAIYLLRGGNDIVLDHNDFFVSDVLLYAAGSVARFDFTNNISKWNGVGISSPSLRGDAIFDTYFPDGIFFKNIIAGGKLTTFVKYQGNYLNPPATLNDVGFTDLTNGDYHLSASSPYKNAGLDGKDIGADVDGIDTATATAISGITN